MGEPLLGIEKSETKHLNCEECSLFKRIRRVQDGERLLQASTPLRKLVGFFINIPSELQEPPEHIGEDFIL